MNRVLITSALPYANGIIHFGHLAGAYLPADCFARYSRMTGKDVLFISGSDEFGVAIELAAEKAGATAKEHSETFHKKNKHLFSLFLISFDHYSRTTNSFHEETVHEFFNDLEKNHYIRESTSLHLYDQTSNRFLADRYVYGQCPECGFERARGDECTSCASSYEASDLTNPRSVLTDELLVQKESTHLYLQFDAFKDRLAKWVEKKSWKPSVSKFVKKYIEDLLPRGISRDTKWGVPIPRKGFSEKVFYVWFDAPIGYISIAKDWAASIGDNDAWKKYFLEETKYVQFIGKDNIPFHGVFFPAMIMGQDTLYNLVDDLQANEFYLLEGKQFSKSNHWYIDVETALTNYGVDALRYYIASSSPESSDSSFSWDDFYNKYSSDLVGKFGNLVNRVCAFIQNKYQSIPKEPRELSKIENNVIESLTDLITKCKVAYTSYSTRQVTTVLMEIATLGNTYFNDSKPWSYVKNNSHHEAEAPLFICMFILKVLALLSFPIVPKASKKLWSMLGFSMSIEEVDLDTELSSMEVAFKLETQLEILFPRIEKDTIDEEKRKLTAL